MAQKAVGYIRVSTEKQADHGVSLAAQREKLEQYAALYDIELIDVVVDAGGSAKTLDREGLQQALNMLGKNGVDSLLIAKLDRLTRSVSDLNTLIEQHFKKFSLLSVADQLDTGSAAGRLVLNVLMSVSQWEREAIAERTSAAMQHMKAQGKYTGGKAPFGFSLIDGELVKNEAEQVIISAIDKMRKAGLSYRAIAAELESKGFSGRTGKPLSHVQVGRLVG